MPSGDLVLVVGWRRVLPFARPGARGEGGLQMIERTSVNCSPTDPDAWQGLVLAMASRRLVEAVEVTVVNERGRVVRSVVVDASRVSGREVSW